MIFIQSLGFFFEKIFENILQTSHLLAAPPALTDCWLTGADWCAFDANSGRTTKYPPRRSKTDEFKTHPPRKTNQECTDCTTLVSEEADNATTAPIQLPAHSKSNDDRSNEASTHPPRKATQDESKEMSQFKANSKEKNMSVERHEFLVDSNGKRKFHIEIY
ncbi:hypothetical protein L3Y34_002165 [Caenorhabditis briggsae]|uniref:Uncharacterized protein n=1 Tax=Caenorhabditis briggsae TaxID=6238 RepID=A0AAE9DER9_CAEBR|nr:hypothetical protein L3Y34_002165 [Caenorhabditis briggsae]